VRDPATSAEWQEAVDAADALLKVSWARAYGLISGGPLVNEARCLELLDEGSRRGIRPAPVAVDGLVIELGLVREVPA
jgi:hypothetical protein